MSTVTKSLRLDSQFLGLTEEYVKLVKEILCFDITVNGVLASSLVNGFSNQLRVFRFIASAKELQPSYPGEKLPTEEQIQKIRDFLEKADNYFDACEVDEDINHNEVVDEGVK